MTQSLFKDADAIVRPWVKCGLDGFPGGGKSTTAAYIAAGIYKSFGVTAPIYIIDNERSSKFLLPLFKAEGIKVKVLESNSIDIMGQAIEEVETAEGILLIDSLTNISEWVVRQHLKEAKRKRLEMQDHGIINSLWRERFEFPFVLANCHIVFTGRATNDWGNEEVTDDHGEVKRGFYLKGPKMQGQKDTLYAPDFAIYMERIEKIGGVVVKKRGKRGGTTGGTATKEIYREATVIKDRSRLCDGKTFRDPTWKDLAPMFEFLKSMPTGQPNTVEGPPLDLFGDDDDRRGFYKRRDVAVEELDGILTNALPGMTAKEKKARQDCLQAVFGTYSKTKIEGMQPERLEESLPLVREWLANLAGALNPASNGGAEFPAELIG